MDCDQKFPFAKTCETCDTFEREDLNYPGGTCD